MVLVRMNPFANDIRRLTREEMQRTGTTVHYTPSTRCSCRRPDGQVSPGCRVCDGYGWFWEPGAEIVVRAILMDGTQERQLAALGLVQRGDLAIVLDRRLTVAAPEDRVRLNVDHLRTFAIPNEVEIVVRHLSAATDSLMQRSNQVLQVIQSDPLRGTTVVYREGVSFSVAPGTNHVDWVLGDDAIPVPGPGTTYSIKYMADYDWIMKQPPLTKQVGSVGLQGRFILSRRQRDQRLAEDLANDPYQAGVI